MGDRANVYVHEGDEPGVYLYTHWNGTELPSIVKKSVESIRGQRRLDDAPYLTRIIFEDMVSKSLGEETGYGIAAYALDGEDRIVDIDTRSGLVTLKGYSYSWTNIPDDPYAFDDEEDSW